MKVTGGTPGLCCRPAASGVFREERNTDRKQRGSNAVQGFQSAVKQLDPADQNQIRQRSRKLQLQRGHEQVAVTKRFRDHAGGHSPHADRTIRPGASASAGVAPARPDRRPPCPARWPAWDDAGRRATASIASLSPARLPAASEAQNRRYPASDGDTKRAVPGAVIAARPQGAAPVGHSVACQQSWRQRFRQGERR